jgi:nicotinate-nucleotide adenylyltransferase
MGADSFRDVTSWYEYERILSEYDVIVATRPGYRNEDNIAANLAPLLQARVVDLRGGCSPSGTELASENIQSPRIYLTDYVEVDVSATGVREAVAQGRSIRDLVPPPVASYIEKYRLYRKS